MTFEVLDLGGGGGAWLPAVGMLIVFAGVGLIVLGAINSEDGNFSVLAGGNWIATGFIASIGGIVFSVVMMTGGSSQHVQVWDEHIDLRNDEVRQTIGEIVRQDAPDAVVTMRDHTLRDLHGQHRRVMVEIDGQHFSGCSLEFSRPDGGTVDAWVECSAVDDDGVAAVFGKDA